MSRERRSHTDVHTNVFENCVNQKRFFKTFLLHRYGLVGTLVPCVATLSLGGMLASFLATFKPTHIISHAIASCLRFHSLRKHHQRHSSTTLIPGQTCLRWISRNFFEKHTSLVFRPQIALGFGILIAKQGRKCNALSTLVFKCC